MGDEAMTGRDPWCAQCPFVYQCASWGVAPNSDACEIQRWSAGHLVARETHLGRMLLNDIRRVIGGD